VVTKKVPQAVLGGSPMSFRASFCLLLTGVAISLCAAFASAGDDWNSIRKSFEDNDLGKIKNAVTPASEDSGAVTIVAQEVEKPPKPEPKAAPKAEKNSVKPETEKSDTADKPELAAQPELLNASDIDELSGPLSNSCQTGVVPPWETDPNLFSHNQFYIRSWIDQGVTFNTASPENHQNGPNIFNDRSNEYEMNQLYLIMARDAITDGTCWDWGARVDLLYGTDYFFTTALGLETWDSGRQRWNVNEGPRVSANGDPAPMYGLAMPQIYAEFATPIGNGLSVKLGHFYSILGNESVMAPDNFFYSHNYAMYYGMPITHTGMLLTYNLHPTVKLHAGLTRGWNKWEDPDTTLSFLGGISFQSWNERASLDFAIESGSDGHGLIDHSPHNRTVMSTVFNRKIGGRTKYALEAVLGNQSQGVIGSQFTGETAYWYGLTNYLYYQTSANTTWGCRFEWFCDEENSRILSLPLTSMVQGRNYFDITFGCNWKPGPRMVVRPELRWDWSDVSTPVSGGVYDDFNSKNQFTAAVDVIYTF
jgi:Putative beta-barrel porin-2, OmpL-like. bbp2